MKTANDLFNYISSLRENKQYDTRSGVVHICVYSLGTSSGDGIEFSVGLDEYAGDLNFVGQSVNGEFKTFDVYPHEYDKAGAYHVSWEAKQTFQDLIKLCPNGRNIQIITGSLRRMLGEEEEEGLL